MSSPVGTKPQEAFEQSPTIDSRTTFSSLAVVIITKNQEWNISRLIESVLEGTADCATREIVVVDSASLDKTLEIAGDYDIGIIRLRPDQRLTPAAGRYVGTIHTTAEYVLFLAGDMELCDGWIERAWRLLQSHPDVGVVTGRLLDLPPSAGDEEKSGIDLRRFADSFEEVPHGGGGALYRRAILDRVGTFCPYLYSDEEPELCLRIRRAGYRVVQMDYPIAYHYTQPRDAIPTVFARWRRNLYAGSGQSIRYHLTDDLLWIYLRERGFGLVPGLVGLVTLGVLAWSVYSGQWLVLWAILLAEALFLIGDALWKRSAYKTALSLSKRLVTLESTIRGFFMKPLTLDRDPVQYDVIKGESPAQKAASQVGGEHQPRRSPCCERK